MKIGIDFDNTIICYDKVFNLAGIERGLIPKDLPWGKNNVRNYLRSLDKEKEWIKLQGLVYGVKLFDASPFEGVKTFFSYCKKKSIDICIVSHKTLKPVLGPPYDLHKSASQWLEKEKFTCDTFFELTREEKINRIASQKCTHFIDDLPEFLSLPGFPDTLTKILFDNQKQYPRDTREQLSFKVAHCWEELLIMVQKGKL